MATREEKIEKIEGEIRKLNDEIGKLETERQSAMADRDTKISLGDQITATRNTLNIKEQRLFNLEQQGKSSRISIVPSQSSRCNPLPKPISTSPPMPSRFGDYSR